MPTLQKPSNSQFEKIFDNVASRYNEISNSYLVALRKNIFGDWAKGKCLEVGAGTGEISKFLLLSHEVVATDISSSMVEKIKRNGIKAYQCDAEKLPFEANSFDTVIAAETLFYLDNPDNFLSEAHRVLKPSGRLLISCASNFPVKFYDRLRSILRSVGIKRGMYFDDGLREFMTTPKLKAMLTHQGFNLIEEKKTPIFPIRGLDILNRILEKTLLKYF